MIVAALRLLVALLGLAVLAAVPSAAGAPAEPFADAGSGLPGAPSGAGEVRPIPRSLVLDARDRRCTEDRAHCIAIETYIPDTCRIIEDLARETALDPHFFARLLWKESLFDPSAVSPAGAQGIAQFMPGTAVLRGLDDAFNPAKALHASAHYLAELSRTYGNIGLAAVASNGGEARAERFIAGEGGLPLETRDYVQAITGHGAEAWRDAPPETLDLALEAERAFLPACIAQAGNRSLREFRTGPQVLPWGVVIASNRERDGAERHAGRLRNRHASVLGGESVVVTQAGTGALRGRYTAQVGRTSRAEADALCDRLRRSGGDCMVLRN
ncbi:lytic transglycosylase domain-containing protein [soil metagenome]